MRLIHLQASPAGPSAAAGPPSAVILAELVRSAAARLASASGSAEVLEAKAEAAVAYDAAKLAGRMARAKQAHDEVIGAVYRAQADAAEIECAAKRRLADEYDAAQQRGEVGQSGARTDLVPAGNEVVPSTADLGLTRKDVHEARLIRDAELVEPGIVHRVVTERVEQRQEPTKAAIREAVLEAARGGLRTPTSRRNPNFEDDPAFDAASKLAGACQDISDLVGRHGPDFILGGCLDAGMHRRTLTGLRAARDWLNIILEKAHA